VGVGAAAVAPVADAAAAPRPSAPPAKDESAIRAEVEAAIAARKAALSAAHCPQCGIVVDTTDAFCRGCGADQREASTS
jgi:uncharacterized OB-fold protein